MVRTVFCAAMKAARLDCPAVRFLKNSTINSCVDSSATFQRLIIMVCAPAFLKPRCKPNTPSSVISPKPVWHADNTTKSNPLKSNLEISFAVSTPSSAPSGISLVRLGSSVEFAPANSNPLQLNDLSSSFCDSDA